MVDWRLTREVVIHLIYLTARLVFTVGTTCWRLMNGTHSRIQQRYKPENHAWSAHVQDVVYRHKFDVTLEPAGMRNFFLIHNRFDHPDIVLRDNITLYNITDTDAIFVECDVDVDVTLMETSGFVAIAQFQHARRVIEVPLASFHRVAGHVGDPLGEVVLISNTARCGSTLLVQFFEETGQSMCYAEPDAINGLSVKMGIVPDKDLEAKLLSCIRLMFKPRKGKTYRANIIKNRGISIKLVDLFAKAYPKTRHLFSYRDGAAVMRSLIRLADGMILFKLALSSANICRPLARFVFSLAHVPFEDPEWYEPGSFNVKCALSWAVCCYNYLDFRKRGMNIGGVRYEDVLEDPLNAGRAILRFLDLPVEWAEQGMRALDKDSQRGSPVSRDAMGRVLVPELTARDTVWIDEICRRHSLPSITEKCVLENTITGF